MQILERNPQVYFHLLQQKLIELIRVGKISEALEFAQQELAPRGEKNVIYSKIISLTSVRIQGSNLYQSQCSSSSYLVFVFLFCIKKL
jgi:aromatic ring hydroxylase